MASTRRLIAFDRKFGSFNPFILAKPSTQSVDYIRINIHIVAEDTHWDPNKARTNFAKHGVAFDDAESALTDPLGLTRDNPDAPGERRFVTVGADALGRIVTVSGRRGQTDLRPPRHTKGDRHLCERNIISRTPSAAPP